MPKGYVLFYVFLRSGGKRERRQAESVCFAQRECA